MNSSIPIRSAVLFSALTAALSFGVGRATDLVSTDGSWWQNSVPDEARPFLIAGMIDAYQSGWSDGAIANGARILKELSDKLSPGNMVTVGNVVFRKTENGNYAALAQVPQFSRTFGYYNEGITDFYATHANKQSTSVGDVFACLTDTPDAFCSQLLKQ